MNLKTAIVLSFSLLYHLFLESQNGLENIIVEKYYVSDHHDTADSKISGKLPIGSTTYRVFLDMLPEYRFQAAYGNSNHELRIETTTKFFNNEDIGKSYPNIVLRRALKRNTVMLDSWLTAGSAGENYYGILKEEDNTLETIVHEKQFLQNRDKSAGIPLTERDGLLAAAETPWPSFFGIDSLAFVFFNSTKGSSFITSNGAWGCLGGAPGPDSLTTNKILIGQFTTDGDFSFELNIQIGKKGGPPENYVARNPVGKEIMLPSLIYRSGGSKASESKSKKHTSNPNN